MPAQQPPQIPRPVNLPPQTRPPAQTPRPKGILGIVGGIVGIIFLCLGGMYVWGGILNAQANSQTAAAAQSQ